MLRYAISAATSGGETVNGEGGDGGGGEEEEIGCPVVHNGTLRFAVAHFDFEYVSTPLLVAVWVLFVSIAKVGKNRNLTVHECEWK